MREGKGDMWQYLGRADALCITTNGFVKHDGTCVMGRGIAKQATDRYPTISRTLGNYLKQYGNRPFKLIKDKGTWIVSYPVKPIVGKPENCVAHMKNKLSGITPGWAVRAELPIITKSAQYLVEMANKHGWKNIIIPQPGCGAGELNWNTVKPNLCDILDNRFIAFTY